MLNTAAPLDGQVRHKSTFCHQSYQATPRQLFGSGRVTAEAEADPGLVQRRIVALYCPVERLLMLLHERCRRECWPRGQLSAGVSDLITFPKSEDLRSDAANCGALQAQRALRFCLLERALPRESACNRCRLALVKLLRSVMRDIPPRYLLPSSRGAASKRAKIPLAVDAMPHLNVYYTRRWRRPSHAMTTRIAFLTAISNFVGCYTTECMCTYVGHTWPSIALLLGGSLCAIINTVVGIAIAEILLKGALRRMSFSTTAGGFLASSFSHNPVAILFGAVIGVAITPARRGRKDLDGQHDV